MRHYELVTILSPMLNQDQAVEAWGRIKDFITNRDGEIINEHSWGTRRLAYPIRKGSYNFLEGSYYLTQFNTERPFNIELETFLRQDERVLRSLVIATGPHSPAPVPTPPPVAVVETPPPATEAAVEAATAETPNAETGTAPAAEASVAVADETEEATSEETAEEAPVAEAATELAAAEEEAEAEEEAPTAADDEETEETTSEEEERP